MTDYGMVGGKFVRKPRTAILESIGDRQKARIAKTLITDGERTALGNLNNIMTDEIDACWSVLDDLANGIDPANAVDYLLKGLAALTGVTARAPQKGSVPVTIVTSIGTSYPAGTMIANVGGQTQNQWTNRETFSAPTPGTYVNVPFVSVGTGPTYAANANTLNKISSPLVGWVSVNNPDTATPGTDAETNEELRARRDESLAVQGSSTLKAVMADVEALGGVVAGNENVQDFFAGGLSPHSIAITVSNDAASDAVIAQTIYDSKAAAIQTCGSHSSHVLEDDGVTTVLDPTGAPLSVYFTRAIPVAVAIVAVVVGNLDADKINAAKAAMYAKRPTKIGQDVLISQLTAALLSVDGIEDVVSVELACSLGPPTTSNLVIPETAIALFDVLDMAVTT